MYGLPDSKQLFSPAFLGFPGNLFQDEKPHFKATLPRLPLQCKQVTPWPQHTLSAPPWLTAYPLFQRLIPALELDEAISEPALFKATRQPCQCSPWPPALNSPFCCDSNQGSQFLLSSQHPNIPNTMSNTCPGFPYRTLVSIPSPAFPARTPPPHELCPKILSPTFPLVFFVRVQTGS